MEPLNISITNPYYYSLLIIFFFTSSINELDKKLLKAYWKGRTKKEELLPDWVTIILILHWMIGLSLLILNWKTALIVFTINFLLGLTGIPEKIGSLIMSPFKQNRK